jgi:hypothetical protein
MKRFAVTFERYFPHEPEEDVCDADDRGFVIQDCSLRDAVSLGLEYRDPSWAGYCEADSFPPRGVRWLSFPYWNDCTREQIEQGIHETRALHIPAGVTESSRRRICRLFGVRGV